MNFTSTIKDSLQGEDLKTHIKKKKLQKKFINLHIVIWVYKIPSVRREFRILSRFVSPIQERLENLIPRGRQKAKFQSEPT